jgi:hypothetical protein
VGPGRAHGRTVVWFAALGGPQLLDLARTQRIKFASRRRAHLEPHQCRRVARPFARRRLASRLLDAIPSRRGAAAGSMGRTLRSPAARAREGNTGGSGDNDGRLIGDGIPFSQRGLGSVDSSIQNIRV